MRRCAAPQCSRAARAVAGLTRVLLQRSVEQHLEQRSDPNGMHMAHAVDGPWAAWAHVNALETFYLQLPIMPVTSG